MKEDNIPGQNGSIYTYIDTLLNGGLSTNQASTMPITWLEKLIMLTAIITGFNIDLHEIKYITVGTGDTYLVVRKVDIKACKNCKYVEVIIIGKKKYQ